MKIHAVSDVERALESVINAMDAPALIALMANRVSLKHMAAKKLASRGLDPQILLLDAYDSNGNWLGLPDTAHETLAA